MLLSTNTEMHLVWVDKVFPVTSALYLKLILHNCFSQCALTCIHSPALYNSQCGLGGVKDYHYEFLQNCFETMLVMVVHKVIDMLENNKKNKLHKQSLKHNIL